MELVCVRADSCTEFEWWAPPALTVLKASVVFVPMALLNLSPSIQTVVKGMPNSILMTILRVTSLMHDVENDVKIYGRLSQDAP